MPADPYARRGVPERWLLPPPPREPGLRRRWESLPFEQRHRLARRSHLPDLEPWEREVIDALAHARIVTAWRSFAAAGMLGWLVLMTVWGFGRSTAPAGQQESYLVAGLGLGVAACAAGCWAASRRLRHARRLRRAHRRTTRAGEAPRDQPK